MIQYSHLVEKQVTWPQHIHLFLVCLFIGTTVASRCSSLFCLQSWFSVYLLSLLLKFFLSSSWWSCVIGSSLGKTFPLASLVFSIRISPASFTARSTQTMTLTSHCVTWLSVMSIWIYLYFMLGIINDLFTALFQSQCPHKIRTSWKNDCVKILCFILWYPWQTQPLSISNNCICAIMKKGKR